MKNNITVLLLYFENKGGAVGKPTCYWFTFLINFGPTGFVKVGSLSNQHFYCEWSECWNFVVDESLGIPALMLPQYNDIFYLLISNYS